MTLLTSILRSNFARFVVSMVVLGTASTVAAHHSFSMFDIKKEVTFKGKVVEFQWTNPHTFIDVDVPVKGGVKRYSFESSGPALMKRNGWKRTSLRAGDMVTIVANPLRDGRAGGMLVEVTRADGTKLKG